jgi:MoaA/NifB/PqqE/SkfB family radical SAM enzyme
MSKPFADVKEKNLSLFKRAALEQREVVDHYPTFLILESTTRCNFRCTMCSLYGDDSKGHDFDRDLFDRKVAPLLPYATGIMLQGVGEPLLSKHFDHFYQTAIDHGVRPVFVTNGSLLNEEKIRRFVRDGVALSFSLDGISHETLTRLRPEAKIGRLFDTLDRIREISRGYGNPEFLLTLICILTRMNVHELPALVDLCHRWNVQKMEIRELSLLPNAPESIRGDPLRQEEIEQNASLFAFSQRKADEFGMELCLPSRFTGEDFPKTIPDGLKSIREKMKPGCPDFPGVCLSPWKEVALYANGEVRPCCFSLEVLGNLYLDDFETIWNGEKIRRYRRAVNSAAPPRPCDVCINPIGINLGSPRHFKTISLSSV